MKQRYHLLDAIRGVAILLMVGYHAMWDAVYLFGAQASFFEGAVGTMWQVIASWTFILLSGFCWCIGRRPLRNGAICFGIGALLTVVTVLTMPQNRIVFGVLTMLGSCMLLMIPLHRLFCRVPAWLGLVGATMLFAITRNMDDGILGFAGVWQVDLPAWLYQNYLTTYLGFPMPGFYSTDYFGVLPWLFLFCVGYFIYQCATKYLAKDARFWQVLQYKIAPLGMFGRHSLLVYLVHQPVVYAVLFVVYALR